MQAQLAALKDGGARVLIVEIEALNLEHWDAIKRVTEQINTIFLLFFFVLVIALLAEYSPLGAAYTDKGGSDTKWMLLIILAIVLGMGWVMFNTLYLDLTNNTLGVIEAKQKLMLDGARQFPDGWPLVQRYSQIVAQLRDSKGITGFALTVLNDRGGVLLFVLFIQAVFGARFKRMVDRNLRNSVEKCRCWQPS